MILFAFFASSWACLALLSRSARLISSHVCIVMRWVSALCDPSGQLCIAHTSFGIETFFDPTTNKLRGSSPLLHSSSKAPFNDLPPCCLPVSRFMPLLYYPPNCDSRHPPQLFSLKSSVPGSMISPAPSSLAMLLDSFSYPPRHTLKPRPAFIFVLAAQLSSFH
ncbi:hypothetical protein B0T10DRAFT_472537 [Thelonectria olida]|uniref:Secreted protein n=1 Tax=Thelonectria olida TaxID=1576542 RepID=A0A9P8WDW1_9HYPO|nr:hypothetical protein B0T10DRAFT_472537 [Thelonectria olida]